MYAMTALNIRKVLHRSNSRLKEEVTEKLRGTMGCDAAFALILDAMPRQEVLELHSELCTIEEWLGSYR